MAASSATIHEISETSKDVMLTMRTLGKKMSQVATISEATQLYQQLQGISVVRISISYRGVIRVHHERPPSIIADQLLMSMLSLGNVRPLGYHDHQTHPSHARLNLSLLLCNRLCNVLVFDSKRA